MGRRLWLGDERKEKAVAILDRFRALVGMRQISELLVVFALISCSTGRFPAAVRAAGARFVDFSDYLLNHHVVFLIGNAIIVSLFMLCRQSDDAFSAGNFYDDYAKYNAAAAAAVTILHPEIGLHSPSAAAESDGGGEAARGREPALAATLQPELALHSPSAAVESDGGGDEGENSKQIVVRAEETKVIECDDVAEAIEKAKRQIQRFQRTQSERLKREISVRTQPVFRRSVTGNDRKTVSSRGAEMETLSNEEFRRKVDAFIDAHWSGGKTGTKNMSFENYPLLKMA